MFATSKPHSFQSSNSNATRPARVPSHPPISYPLGSNRPASQSSTSVESAQNPRSSRQNLMQWLSRHSTQSSISSTKGTSKEPEKKTSRSIELVSNARSGPLGAGATVVKTPQDALRDSRVRTTFDGKLQDFKLLRTASPESARSGQSGSSRSSQKAGSMKDAPLQDFASALEDPSPPLPSIPLPQQEDDEADTTFSAPDPVRASTLPPRPTREIPPPPSPSTASSQRSSLKPKVDGEEPLEPVPPLPKTTPPSPKVPPFKAILMSDVPRVVDRAQTIVTLETCTSTYKTTFETLTSRPSHLATYLVSLLERSPRLSAASSVYSTDSEEYSDHGHSAKSDSISRPPTNIHIFLDRSSAPYHHILNYLRSTQCAIDAPEVLPRSVFAQPSSAMRLEAVLELRDEATYLQLDGLRKLCMDEIRHRQQSPRIHVRGVSASTAASNHSINASVSSLHTLLERGEGSVHADARQSKDSDSRSLKEASRFIPTPQSWRSESGDRNHSKKVGSIQSPPAGWI